MLLHTYNSKCFSGTRACHVMYTYAHNGANVIPFYCNLNFIDTLLEQIVDISANSRIQKCEAKKKLTTETPRKQLQQKIFPESTQKSTANALKAKGKICVKKNFVTNSNMTTSPHWFLTKEGKSAGLCSVATLAESRN